MRLSQLHGSFFFDNFNRGIAPPTWFYWFIALVTRLQRCLQVLGKKLLF
jgi:hypothetical protein